MINKAALAVFGLVLGAGLMAPSKAAAEVHVGVSFGAPVVYGAVAVQPSPYVVYGEPAPSEYVAYGEPVYYGSYPVEQRWRDGDREAYYYGHRYGHGGRWADRGERVDERGEHWGGRDRYADGRGEWRGHDRWEHRDRRHDDR
jgi:hypothetical protein